MLTRRHLCGAAFAALLLLPACGSDSNASEAGPSIVATTGHINDAARAILDGTDVELKLLCGPGVDPHSYSASTKDVIAMEAADAILFNGFHLEAKLADVLARDGMADRTFEMAAAFPAERRLDWVEDGEVDPDAPFDPHIWNDLEGWSACVTALAAHLATLYPEDAEAITANGAAYVDTLMEAHAWAATTLAALPAERRLLVSGHDAFNYFARAYELEPVAVLGVGNDAEADLVTMREVGQIIADRQVPAIFVESITSPQLTQALKEASEAKGWDVKIAESPLYSDDLGAEAPVNTFMGAFRANVETIAEALGE